MIRPFNRSSSLVRLVWVRQHIRRESRELWKAHTLRDFFEVRIPYEKNEIKEPRNWRKVYIVRAQRALQPRPR